EFDPVLYQRGVVVVYDVGGRRGGLVGDGEAHQQRFAGPQGQDRSLFRVFEGVGRRNLHFRLDPLLRQPALLRGELFQAQVFRLLPSALLFLLLPAFPFLPLPFLLGLDALLFAAGVLIALLSLLLRPLFLPPALLGLLLQPLLLLALPVLLLALRLFVLARRLRFHDRMIRVGRRQEALHLQGQSQGRPQRSAVHEHLRLESVVAFRRLVGRMEDQNQRLFAFRRDAAFCALGPVGVGQAFHFQGEESHVGIARIGAPEVGFRPPSGGRCQDASLFRVLQDR